MKTVLCVLLLLAAGCAVWSPPVYGADGRYLGNLSANPYDPNSISNPFGRYGSPYSPDSVNNPYFLYGSPFSPYSARNPFATSPPQVYSGTPFGLPSTGITTYPAPSYGITTYPAPAFPAVPQWPRLPSLPSLNGPQFVPLAPPVLPLGALP
jgi:hypothetical protein